MERLPLPIRRNHDSPFPLYTIRLPYRSASFTVFTFSKISSSRNSNPSKIAPFILPFLAYAFLFSETPSSFRSDDIKISAISFIIYPFPPSYIYIFVCFSKIPSLPNPKQQKKVPPFLLRTIFFTLAPYYFTYSRLFSFVVLPILLRSTFLASCGFRPFSHHLAISLTTFQLLGQHPRCIRDSG